ncbi:GAF domain-containing sensor histidine kinase [Pedobacter sp. GSP4]|uniref:GAF domain-containing sensor histidine kinase n=1 Tax=Pedobacter sp. GSP4 TaxID=3453716 RepID=UPI003EE91E8E
MHNEKVGNTLLPDGTLRLHKLMQYDILDTPAEQAFDNIAQLAANIFDLPHAGIIFEGNSNIFHKAVVGKVADFKLPLPNTVTVNDIQPIIGQHIAFFASAPICTPEGYNIGLIYVYDTVPHQASHKEINMLNLLAEMVMDKLEVRAALRRTFKAYDDRLHVLVHDLKNPMTTISLQSELVGRIQGIDEKAVLIAGKINAQSKRMVDNLNNILSSAKKESRSFKPQKARVELKVLLEEVKNSLNLVSTRKNQTIQLNIDPTAAVFGDAEKLQVVFNELIGNAIKFSHLNQEINITQQATDHEITIIITDNGVGLTAEDLDRLFLKFANLSAQPTHQESGNGLGLITANAFVEMHKGKLWAESKGKNQGTSFYVTLPIK